ncbi:hypothetical protein MJO28_013474 [Puccinia striiformis f. sp. tritici]|uniref:Uncharacterized protein n=1 Tax=Puccinia striiformis f. sp. tritici TaxID=168172 RepID=A0ACC0E0G0_9BASI|nr:hypothetical protein MJO28_013474 [Puccinia striiformis f. sp. tritici]
MVSFPVAFILVISLLNAGKSLQQAGKPAPLDIKCSNKKQLRPADCVKAYQKIIYEADSTTDTTEVKIEKVFGTCTTVIENPKHQKVPKAKIEDAFNQMGGKCNGLTGNVVLPAYDGVRLLVRHHTRRYIQYEDDFPILEPLCRSPPGQAVAVADCKEAYDKIPTNDKGQVVSIDKHEHTDLILSTVRTCVMSVETSDWSSIWGPKTDFDKAYKILMDGCGTQGGYLVTQGAQGKNGKIILQATEMISCRVILIVAISLLNAGESLQQAGKPAPLDIKCSNKKQLLPADCIKAYQQIIYNGDSTTDSNAGKIEKAFGSCTVHGYRKSKILESVGEKSDRLCFPIMALLTTNADQSTIPKAIIEDAFNQLGAKCKGLTGNVVLPNYDGVRLLARHHSRRFARYEDSHPLLQPLCRAPPPKDVIPSECKAAYEAFPTNAQGQLMSIDKHQQSNMMISTVKGCVAEMISYRVVFIVAVSLLNAGKSLQQAGKPAPLDIKCSNKKQLRPADCVSAYKKIIYDGDSTTDIMESLIERVFGTCTVAVENPKFLKVPRAKIEDAFNQMGAKCNGLTGNVILPGYDGVRLLVRHHTRRYVKYENDIGLLEPLCFRPPVKAVVTDDCKKAWDSIPTNDKGQPVSIDTHQTVNSIHSIAGICFMDLSTSDHSRIWGSVSNFKLLIENSGALSLNESRELKTEMDHAFKLLMDGCGTRGGYIVVRGALGKNGNIILQAIAAH